ncbi:FG-GAP-like repeat-containing protein [Streptomyces sp. NPDC059740]|uniref:FG-GAP-like repeat-containing protein n=1 Tax=Streptomyces sp. NPDC059740 TaxID=3346926 RepID=UPI003651A53A
MNRGLRAAVAVVAAATLAGPASGFAAAAAPAPSSPAGSAPTHQDVDGDGYADLLVGAPGATVKDHAKAGYVALTFGSTTGVDMDRHQGLTQAHTGVPGTPEAGDAFGQTVATGDMDGDGHTDLVVSAPGESIGDVKAAGSVTVVFGSASGLSDHAIAFHAPKPTAGRHFGDRIALGDFDHDGRDDLAVVDGSKADVVKGAANLRDTATPKITSLTPPVGSAGLESVRSGDVNGDGYADLVTVGYDDDPADEGTLAVLPGSSTGLRATLLGKSVGLPFAGYRTVVGDVNGDGKDDVLLDTSFEDGPDDYKLRILPGATGGLDTASPVVWQAPLLSGTATQLADVDGDGHDDLVVADTFAGDSDGINSAGALTVVSGGTDWLDPASKRTVSLDTDGVSGVAEGGDLFGSAVAPADYNGDGTADLAVGVPGKHDEKGGVSMLYGSADGITPKGSILFGPDTFKYPWVQARFGAAVAGTQED